MTAKNESEARFVCHACIGDAYLKDEIKRAGTRAKCMVCDEEKRAISFDVLCERVHIHSETAQKRRHLKVPTSANAAGRPRTELCQTPCPPSCFARAALRRICAGIEREAGCPPKL